MKRGLIIGKFLPVHSGHLALINFAASNCDELIVSMTYTSEDPIDGQIRFEWLKELLKNNPAIKPAISLDDFDDETLPLSLRLQRWVKFIKTRFPPIHIIFSSEEYGALFAHELGGSHKLFDLARIENPVSGTQIRKSPFKYWDYIPTLVRPYFVKKICFYGPESTGKSSIGRQMAAMYNTEFVPEVARELTTDNNFSADDIIEIGYAQTRRILEKIKTANKILICDTDLITTQIYSKIYLGEVPQVLYDLEHQMSYDHYFLFDIDVPWIDDGLRDLGHRRKEMYDWFKNELDIRGIAYQIVNGTWKEREKIVVKKIEKIIRNSSL